MFDNLEVAVTIDGKKVPLGMTENLKIDPKGIEEAIIQYPVMLAQYGVLYEKARVQRERTNRTTDATEAALSMKYRNTPLENGKPPSNEKVAEMVETDPDMIRLRAQLVEVTHEEKLAFVAFEAFRYRKDCLLAIAQSQRAGMLGYSGTGGADKAEDNLKTQKTRTLLERVKARK